MKLGDLVPLLQAGGPGSGRHPGFSLERLRDMHDQVKDHPARSSIVPSESQVKGYSGATNKLYNTLIEHLAASPDPVRKKLYSGYIEMVNTSLDDAEVARAQGKQHAPMDALNWALAHMHTIIQNEHSRLHVPLPGDFKK